MKKDLCIGRICKASAGRGKGRYFIICKIVDDEYVLLTDGKTRKWEHPKRKKSKHLICRPYVAEDIATAIAQGRTPLDAEIREALGRVAAIESNKEKQLV